MIRSWTFHYRGNNLRRFAQRSVRREALLSSLITVLSAIVKKLDQCSRQCLAQHDETSETALRANKLVGIGDGQPARGARVDPPSPPACVADISGITTCVGKDAIVTGRALQIAR